MNILNTVTCDDIALQNLLTIAKGILNIVQICGPLLCIISLAILFTKLVVNPEDKNKKIMKGIKNSLLALVILFFVPLFVTVTMNAVDQNSNLSACWKSSSGVKIMDKNAKYIDSGKKSNFLVNSNEYNPGNPSGGKASKVVFIGDSRTVQMYAYYSNNWSGANYSSGGVHTVGDDIYVAEGSQGLSWLKSTGINAAKPYFKKGTAIVILMGVNDLYNSSSYISYINSNAASWTKSGSTLYFSAVTPCNGSYSNLNSKISSFNSSVKRGLNKKVTWIDTDSHLAAKGYSTTDGLHYDKATSQKIHDYIKSKV